jgi:hypothetical protein
MLKVITPADYGNNEPTVYQVRISARGLRGFDKNAFIKRAGYDFLPYLDRARPGEVPIHLLAMGATEYTGNNRNGDGFRESRLIKYHDTFEKYAHYFHDHQNRPNHLRYGRVLKSAYHQPMGRAELLVGLYETADAARRGAGDLGRIADRDLDKLASDSDLAVSMSCRVPEDVCSFCKNRAANRDEYCDDRPVKLASGRVIPACSGFGCKYGLTKIAADGRIQYVDNPDPTFFDISGVGHPADRIAYAMGRLGDAMAKAAAAGSFRSGAELAELYGIDSPRLVPPGASKTVARRLGLLADLAEAGQGSCDATHDLALVKGAEFNPPAVLRAEPSSAPAAFRALADAGIALGVADWLHLVVGVKAAAVADVVAARVPATLLALRDGPDAPAVLAGDEYAPGPDAPPAWRRWAAKLADDRSLRGDRVVRRLRLAALHETPRPAPVKAAAASDPATDALAREYVRYQVDFLGAQPDDSPDSDLIRSLIVRRAVVG